MSNPKKIMMSPKLKIKKVSTPIIFSWEEEFYKTRFACDMFDYINMKLF